MESRSVAENKIAELKVLVLQEQERVAGLHRRGQHSQARTARHRLFGLLYRLDVLEAVQSNGVEKR